ncbi:MAG: O-antigen ligase domain-containing protein, partial [Pedobacter sp.]
YTTDTYKFKPNTIGIIAIAATQFSILFALSRASLASYLIMIYVYALVTKNKLILRTIYFAVISGIIYFIFFLFVLHPDLYDFIYETITFTNPSSVGHIIAWLEGIDAIVKHPLGMGLGASGVLASTNGGGTGGENQYIIIGVQTGLVGLALYLYAHISLIITCWRWYPKLSGKSKTICLTVLLIQIGIVIPMMTSELESSAYISYVSWFFSGLLINVVAQRKTKKEPNLSKLTD